MNAAELESLFAQWRSFTEAEREAIANEDWARVHREQHGKEELTRRLSIAAAGWRKESPCAQRLRPLIAELSSLETDNARSVGLQRERTRNALAEIERAEGNLRGLNRAYGTAPNANWTSYS